MLVNNTVTCDTVSFSSPCYL